MAEEKNTDNKNLNLASMVSKKLSDNETKNWFSNLGDPPEVSTYEDTFYYTFKNKGISILFRKPEILRTIFLYAEGTDDFSQYQGVLPFQLTFDLNRKTIESIFGKPESSGGGKYYNFYVSYDSKGIGITYNTLDPDDMDAKIYHMRIKSPKPQLDKKAYLEWMRAAYDDVLIEKKKQEEEKQKELEQKKREEAEKNGITEEDIKNRYVSGEITLEEAIELQTQHLKGEEEKRKEKEKERQDLKRFKEELIEKLTKLISGENSEIKRIDKERLIGNTITALGSSSAISDAWDDLYPAEDKFGQDCRNYLDPGDLPDGITTKIVIEEWINNAFINLKNFYGSNWEVQVEKEDEYGDIYTENVPFYEAYDLKIPELKLSDLDVTWKDDIYNVNDHMFEIIENNTDEFLILYHCIDKAESGWYSEFDTEWNDFWDKVLEENIENYLIEFGKLIMVMIGSYPTRAEAESYIQTKLEEYREMIDHPV